MQHAPPMTPQRHTYQNPIRIPYQATYSYQTLLRMKEATEIREQNTHPTKTRSDNNTQVYKHPELKCIDTSIKTQSISVVLFFSLFCCCCFLLMVLWGVCHPAPK
ncbi:hypothetical protein LEMLEM_LOCUS12619 [Lemmus lemmus]